MNVAAFGPLLGYILSILILNLGFSYVPMIDLGFGLFSPMAILAGLVFVLRDYAQRAVGHYVLVGMATGAVLSFALADPFIAYASVAAFAISEIGDWLIYTTTKKPFHQRVLVSSVIATPIDTAVFLTMIDGMTIGTFGLMVLAKMVAAVVIWFYYRR
ncbi:MAG: hypothetical protein ACRCYS_04140 [Beijerinckiaceae bacterium]